MSRARENLIRIATRASRLALWQANHVAELLRRAAPGCEVELVHVSTVGDRDRVEPLHHFGGVGVFTREVQRAVLDGRADLAVHSLKDLPTEPVDRLALAAVPERAVVFDALILPIGVPIESGFDSLPSGARVGTGSLRRQAQLLHHRPDLRMLEIRGNVETRLRKLDEGEYDAIVLAVAGLSRLELGDRISSELRPPLLYPAVGQGALGIECRTDDRELQRLLESITDRRTHAAATAERAVLAEMRAGCHAPLGAVSGGDGERLTLEAVVLSRDGRERMAASAEGTLADPVGLGRRVAEEFLRQGAGRFVTDPRRTA